MPTYIKLKSLYHIPLMHTQYILREINFNKTTVYIIIYQMSYLYD